MEQRECKVGESWKAANRREHRLCELWRGFVSVHTQMREGEREDQRPLRQHRRRQLAMQDSQCGHAFAHALQVSYTWSRWKIARSELADV